MFRSITSIIVIATCFLTAQAVHWTNLEFKKGDVLRCNLNLFAYHVLLATSSSTVAHMAGDKSTNTGYLWEESWNSYHRREGQDQTECSIKGSAYSPSLAVEKAREDIARYGSQRIYYDLLSCNCEHWVNKWAYGSGTSASSQSRLDPSSNCDVNKHPITENDFFRIAAGAMNTNGYKCRSECTVSDDGKYFCRIGITMWGKGHCSPRRRTTYKGQSCYSECKPYLNYYYCYTDSSWNWDYCGPSV